MISTNEVKVENCFHCSLLGTLVLMWVVFGNPARSDWVSFVFWSTRTLLSWTVRRVGHRKFLWSSSEGEHQDNTNTYSLLWLARLDFSGPHRGLCQQEVWGTEISWWAGLYWPCRGVLLWSVFWWMSTLRFQIRRVHIDSEAFVSIQERNSGPTSCHSLWR